MPNAYTLRVGEPSAAPAPVDFNVDWGTATGTSVAALGDGGKLSGSSNGFCSVVGRAAEVTAESLTDMPTDWPTNLFKLAFSSGGFEFWQATNQWAAPAQGEYMFVRLLVYFGLPENADLGQGCKILQTNSGGINWVFPDTAEAIGADGLFSVFFASLSGNVVPAPAFGRWQYNSFETYKPYRFEIRLENVAGSDLTFKPSIRVYEESTSKLVVHLDGSDFHDNYGTGADDMESDDPVITGDTVTNIFRQLIVGNSDQSGTTTNGGAIYKAGLAVRISESADDWIGAYPTTGET